MDKRIVDRLNGFLQAFAWINHKADNQYSFEPSVLPAFTDTRKAIEYYAENYLGGYNDVSINLSGTQADWQTQLNKLLSEWLFNFQVDPFNDDICLRDKRGYFSLSRDSSRQDMLQELLADFARITDFQYGCEVKLL